MTIAAYNSIGAAGELDNIAYSLLAGHAYQIKVQAAVGSALDPEIVQVLDPSQSVLAGVSNTDYGFRHDAEVSFTPAVAGQYSIGVQGQNSTTGNYVVTVTDLDAPVAAASPVTIAAGQTFAGVVAQDFGTQTVFFDLSAGRSYSFTLSKATSGHALDTPVLQGIYDDSGKTMAGSVARVGADGSATISVTPTQSGTYHAVVGDNFDDTGSFTLTFKESKAAAATSDNVIGDEGDDFITTGSTNDLVKGGAGNDFIDGGAGTDTAVFAGNRSAYSISVKANGDVTISGSDGIDTLRNIEILQFDDASASLMNLLPKAHLTAPQYYGKVQSYFLAMAGRAATSAELTQYADLLSHQSGSVWLDANGATGTTGSLVGALNISTDFTNLTSGKSNSQIVDEMFHRLTGTTISQSVHDYYVGKLDAHTMKAKGLANAMLNDLAIMPKADNTLGQPGTWQVNMFDQLSPSDYLGYVNELKLMGIQVTNLDSAGNLA